MTEENTSSESIESIIDGRTPENSLNASPYFDMDVLVTAKDNTQNYVELARVRVGDVASSIVNGMRSATLKFRGTKNEDIEEDVLLPAKKTAENLIFATEEQIDRYCELTAIEKSQLTPENTEEISKLQKLIHSRELQATLGATAVVLFVFGIKNKFKP